MGPCKSNQQTMNTYIESDHYLHQLAQLLSRTNKAFHRAKPDDSHTNMFFEGRSNRLYGRRMMIPDSGLQFYPAIDIMESTFLVVDNNGAVTDELKLTGKSFEEATKELSALWRTKGLDTLSFEQPMHYEITTYTYASGKLQSPAKKGLEAWSNLRATANEAVGALGTRFLATSSVRIWPHHFDSAIYLQVADEFGIGVGLAMADEVCEVPYFYVQGQSSAGKFNYGIPKTKLGEWHLDEGWNGGLLPANTQQGQDFNQILEWLKSATEHIYSQIRQSID